MGLGVPGYEKVEEYIDLGGHRTFKIMKLIPGYTGPYNPWYGSWAWNDIGKIEVVPLVEMETMLHLLFPVREPPGGYPYWVPEDLRKPYPYPEK